MNKIQVENWNKSFEKCSLQLLSEWKRLLCFQLSLGLNSAPYQTQLASQTPYERDLQITQLNSYGFLDICSEEDQNNSFNTSLFVSLLNNIVKQFLDKGKQARITQLFVSHYENLDIFHHIIKAFRYLLNLDPSDVEFIVSSESQKLSEQKLQQDRKTEKGNNNSLSNKKRIKINFDWLSKETQQTEFIFNFQILMQNLAENEVLSSKDYNERLFPIYYDFLALILDVKEHFNIDLKLFQNYKTKNTVQTIVSKFVENFENSQNSQTDEQRRLQLQVFTQFLMMLKDLSTQELYDFLLQDQQNMDFCVKMWLHHANHIEIFSSFSYFFYYASLDNEEICKLLNEKFNIVFELLNSPKVRYTQQSQQQLGQPYSQDYEDENSKLQSQMANLTLYQNAKTQQQRDLAFSAVQKDIYTVRSLASIQFSWILQISLNIATFIPSNVDFLKINENKILYMLQNLDQLKIEQLYDLENIGLLLLQQYEGVSELFSSCAINQDYSEAIESFIVIMVNHMSNLFFYNNSSHTYIEQIVVQIVENSNITLIDKDSQRIIVKNQLINVQEVLLLLFQKVTQKIISDSQIDNIEINVADLEERLYGCIAFNIGILKSQFVENQQQTDQQFSKANKSILSLEFQKQSGLHSLFIGDIIFDNYLMKLHCNSIKCLALIHQINKQIIDGKQGVIQHSEMMNSNLEDLKNTPMPNLKNISSQKSKAIISEALAHLAYEISQNPNWNNTYEKVIEQLEIYKQEKLNILDEL